MMKRVIAILMAVMICMTCIACSKQPTTQIGTESSEYSLSETVGVTSAEQEKENSDDTDAEHSEKATENSTPSTETAPEEMVTSEKEDDTTTPTVTSPPKKDTEQTDPPKETEETAPPKATETTKPVEETTEATEPPSTEAPTEATQSTEPEETIQSEPPSTYEIESLVAQYINQYRAAQGDTTAIVLTGLTEVARYRARQLVTDFSHNSNPNPCTVLQYGEYIDMTLFGGDASESYYRGYNREAIGKGDWFGTADQMAQRIANGFKKSSSHWAYVGDSEYSYMAVGVIYNEADGKWYCCICMSSKNYGD